MKDDVDIDIHYTRDDSPEWYKMGKTWKNYTPYLYKDAPSGKNIPVATARPHPEFQTCSSDDTPEKITERNRNVGYFFQLRIDLTGYVSIRQGRLKGKQRASERSNAGQIDMPEDQLNNPPIDDFTYNSDSLTETMEVLT
jgi:hypothetical protein